MNTNTTSIAFIGIRLVAIYLLATGLTQLPNYAYVLGSSSANDFALVLLLPLLAPTFCGAILLFTTNFWVRLILPKHPVSNSDDQQPSPTNSVVFAATGVLIISLQVPPVSYAVLSLVQYSEVAARELPPSSMLPLVSELVVLALGIWLFSGSTFWARIYGAFREFGLEEK